MFLAIATIIISGARLIDGRGGPPIEDSVVVIEADRIVSAGPRESVTPPAGQSGTVPSSGATVNAAAAAADGAGGVVSVTP